MSKPKCTSAYNLGPPHDCLSSLRLALAWRDGASADFDEAREDTCTNTIDFASFVHYASFDELDLAWVEYLKRETLVSIVL